MKKIETKPKKQKNRTKAEMLANRKVMGRPKIYDFEKMAIEIDEWSSKESSLNLVGFCTEKGYLPELIWRAKYECKNFDDNFMMAKMRLADRREKLMNAELLNYGSWNRYQKNYDPFLDRFEDAEADKKFAREKKIADTQSLNLASLAKLLAEGKIKQE